MTTQDNAVSQTIPHRSGGSREAARNGALAVIGDGASLDSVRGARLVAITGLTLDIGRRPSSPDGRATLALSDGTVSSLHARIQRAGDGSDLYVIQDLGSTNGTYVDGSRVLGPTPLSNGAV